MLFKRQLAIQICEGNKTQTRRIVKPNEHYDAETQTVYAGKKRKWVVGRTYGVQIARGGHSLNKFVLKGIRRERACDITEQDAIAEGFASRDEFFEAWRAINGKGTLDSEVWVLDFEPVFKYGQEVVLEKCTHGDMQHIQLPATGVMRFNWSKGDIFWLVISGKRYYVPIDWLKPVPAVRTECIICHAPAFADDMPMCLDCAQTVEMADDVFPVETHPVIKPIASRITNLIFDAETERRLDELWQSYPEPEYEE